MTAKKDSRPTGGLSTKAPVKGPAVGRKPAVTGNRGIAKPMSHPQPSGKGGRVTRGK
jgi:hypothetical protein